MEVKVMRTPKVEQDNSKKRTITSKHFEIVLPIFVCLTYKLKVGKYFNDELKEYANINSYQKDLKNQRLGETMLVE